MDTMLIGFLVGAVASGVSVLLIVRLTGEKLVLHKLARTTTHTRPQIARATISRKQSKPRRVKHRSIHKLRNKPQLQPIATNLEAPTVSPAQTLVSACPACGLQAPENLMVEHFMGSPSHQYGPVQTIATVAVNNAEEEAYVEEDSENSVRSLLQMLVPPRAFGRRHAHRTVSPLSRIVETTGDYGH